MKPLENFTVRADRGSLTIHNPEIGAEGTIYSVNSITTICHPTIRFHYAKTQNAHPTIPGKATTSEQKKTLRWFRMSYFEQPCIAGFTVGREDVIGVTTRADCLRPQIDWPLTVRTTVQEDPEATE